jgi:hypothetical protein
MIIKYLKDGVWGYIDNVRQVGNKSIIAGELIAKYDEEVKKGERDDDASYIDFTTGIINAEKEGNQLAYQRLPEDVIAVNKVFLMATELLPEEIRELGYSYENFLNGEALIENFPVNMIMLHLNKHKECDVLVLVTNQKTYLMNDEGKTIERLV